MLEIARIWAREQTSPTHVKSGIHGAQGFGTSFGFGASRSQCSSATKLQAARSFGVCDEGYNPPSMIGQVHPLTTVKSEPVFSFGKGTSREQSRKGVCATAVRPYQPAQMLYRC